MIKRYNEPDYVSEEIIEDPTGRLVWFEDHEAEVKRLVVSPNKEVLEVLIKELEAEVQRLEETIETYKEEADDLRDRLGRALQKRSFGGGPCGPV